MMGRNNINLGRHRVIENKYAHEVGATADVEKLVSGNKVSACSRASEPSERSHLGGNGTPVYPDSR